MKTTGATKMNNGETNRSFRASLDAETSGKILASIADDYRTSVMAIFEEVVDEEAQNLLEYMVEPMRSATSVLMQRFNANQAA